jgi:hypothetical protein
MRRSHLSILAVLCAACTKSSANDAKPAPSTSVAASASAPAASASSAVTTTSSHAVAGVGDIPAWSADAALPSKCKTSAEAKARIHALSSGTDAATTAGTADPAALAKDVGATTCAPTRRELTDALNDGGYEHYKAKKYAEAERWWRAALVVRPSAMTARYNLACGLALDGKAKDAVWVIQEIARAAADGDASAVNFLEKSKSDSDLTSLRTDAEFNKAVASASAVAGVLVGPRKEPETSAEAVKLLPAEYTKVKDDVGVTQSGWFTYKPALVHVWTWRPDASNELILATIVDDPAKLGKPKGDMNMDYGGFGVFKREKGALKLLLAQKTGESPPALAARGKDIAVSFDTPCGDIHGTIKWDGSKPVYKETPCSN